MSVFTPHLPANGVRRSSLLRLLLAAAFALVGTACANPDNAPESAYDEGEPAVIDHAALPLAQRVMVGAFTYGGVWQGMGPVLDLEAELGRRLDVGHWFTNWRNEAYPEMVIAVAEAGR